MNKYPIIDGDMVIILDDYSLAATGKELKLDFSDIAVENIKKEAKECIIGKYKNKSASPTYLRVLIPAVRRFALFAKDKGLHSFAEYTEEIADAYLAYLNNLNVADERRYSTNYIRYLWSVPLMIKNSMVNS